MNGHQSQRGLALVMVMWFVAAMALLVGGIMAAGKIDRSGTQAGVFSARAIALGDGAIRVGVTEYIRSQEERLPIFVRSIQINDTMVILSITNGANLLNINSTSSEQLTLMLAQGVPLDPVEAQLLAERIVAYRNGHERYDADLKRPRQFLTLEELLLVPGLGRDVFDAVRDLACACEPSSATLGEENFAALLSARDMLVRQSDTFMEETLAQNSPVVEGIGGSELYRVDALMEMGGRLMLRRQWIKLGGGRGSRLGWESVQKEAVRIVKST